MNEPKFNASSFFEPNPGNLNIYLSLYFHRHWSMMSPREALILFMNIDDNSFIRKFCLDKFQSNYRLSSDNTELIVPSLFVDNDYKRHMSINLVTGLWRCFKSGETGNFTQLYSKIEKCSYREAYEALIYEEFLSRGVFREPKKFEIVDPDKIVSNLDDAKDFEVVEDHPHVTGRMLNGFKFYVAKEGSYKGRLIIPFINSKGKMFYFQARTLSDAQPKYLNCKNLKSSQVLYPFDYGSHEPLYVTEGVFDCMSLQACGLNATTTLSCFTSKEQMLQLSQYQGPLVCAFDNDIAGLHGTRKFMEKAHWINRDDLFMVSPSGVCKDWNQMLVQRGPDALLRDVKELNKLDHLNLEMAELAYNKG